MSLSVSENRFWAMPKSSDPKPGRDAHRPSTLNLVFPMPTYKCLNGLVLTYPDPSPEIAAFIDRVQAAAADPAVDVDQMLLLVSGTENPLLDKTRIPGRALVTRTVLDNPVYNVLHDLIGVKEVNLGLVDLAETEADYVMRQRDYREVYHSLRNAGEWGIDLEKNWKIFRYHPGMFKIQVQHQGSSTGKNENDSSVDQLLGLIVREIDRHLAEKN